MPLYEIGYICNLSDQQQDQLAEAITNIHAEKFTTPKMFVNVSFQRSAANAYVAGKRHNSNHIKANVRTGPTRTKQDFDDVAAQISRAWEEVVGTKGDAKLRAVFILTGLLSVHESGIVVPPAGEEAQWIAANFGELQKLADGGDEEFQDLVLELKTRECFKGVVPAA